MDHANPAYDHIRPTYANAACEYCFDEQSTLYWCKICRSYFCLTHAMQHTRRFKCSICNNYYCQEWVNLSDYIICDDCFDNCI